MIRYALRCGKDHGFESWFASASAYDALEMAGQLTCPECGDLQITKALMAPKLASAEDAVAVLSEPKGEVEKALAALKRKIERDSDYVGADFAKEARAIHSGTVPERSIYGEARPDEARALMEEGVPLMPLPFRPKRKVQ